VAKATRKATAWIDKTVLGFAKSKFLNNGGYPAGWTMGVICHPPKLIKRGSSIQCDLQEDGASEGEATAKVTKIKVAHPGYNMSFSMSANLIPYSALPPTTPVTPVTPTTASAPPATTAPPPPTTTTTRPPAPPSVKGVTLTSCTVDPDDNTLVMAGGTLVNRTGSTADFLITAEILEGTLRVGTIIDAEDSITPGQTSTWSGEGEVTGGPGGAFSCKIVTVQIIPSA
jgi:hypothetical protein